MNPEELLQWLLQQRQAAPPMAPKTGIQPPAAPAPLPTNRPTQLSRDEVVEVQGGGPQPPQMILEGENRPIHQQPVRFLPREDGQPAFSFVVDPSTGQVERWVPPGAGQGQSITAGQRRIMRQVATPPPPGQLPPRSVAVPPPTALEAQAERVDQSREGDRGSAMQRLMELQLPQEELDRHFAEMNKTTNPGDALRRLLEARNAR